jgi:hypothetical protein
MKSPKLNFFQRRRLKKEQNRKDNINYLTSLANLKETTKIKSDQFTSEKIDLSKWNFIRQRFSKRIWCLVLLHYPDSRDVIRYYPIIRPFTVEIKKTPYLFSPKSFRVMGKYQKLEFYVSVPFAILHNVGNNYKPPSLDSEAFASVMASKHIQDATKTEDQNFNAYFIAMLVISIFALIIGIINAYLIYKKIK